MARRAFGTRMRGTPRSRSRSTSRAAAPASTAVLDVQVELDQASDKTLADQIRGDMVKALNPPVVGHFDLVRLFDPDYKSRLQQSQIAERVQRNLDLIKERGLILDFNLAGFDKLAGEPYPSRDILAAAIERGIALVPGDDSHGIRTVGRHFARGMALLEELGGELDWKKPPLKEAL